MTPSREYLDLIADRIAQALSPLVPPEYDVLASGGEIAVGTRPISPWCGYPFTDNVLENVGLNPDESTTAIIASVTGHLLDSVQQDITMDLKVPWPPVVGKPLGHFADPRVKIEGHKLHLWFDVGGHPLLSTEVSLSERE